MAVIAIDFDNTITENLPRPQIAPFRKEAKKFIKKLYDRGYTLVLWTSRGLEEYAQACERLSDEGLIHYFSRLPRKGVLGKISADFYIDDRAIPGKLNWKKIYRYIIRHI